MKVTDIKVGQLVPGDYVEVYGQLEFIIVVELPDEEKCINFSSFKDGKWQHFRARTTAHLTRYRL